MNQRTMLYIGAGAAVGVVGYLVYRHFYVPLDTDKVVDAKLEAAGSDGKAPAKFKFDRGPSLEAKILTGPLPTTQALATLKGVAVGRSRAEVKSLTTIGA